MVTEALFCVVLSLSCLHEMLCYTRHTTHVTRHTSHVTRHTSHVIRHTSYVIRHTSYVIRHTSHVTRHTSYVTRHMSLATRHSPLQVELFPRRCRGLANSIAYNIALAVFGGLVRLRRRRRQYEVHAAVGTVDVHWAGEHV
jgi:hypothetical protein